MSRGRPSLSPPPLRTGLPYSIVFVCSGNICRSPMAEIITRTVAVATELADGSSLGDLLELSSAGTGPWHDGEPMYDKTAQALARGGYPDHPHIARQVSAANLRHYDLIVALDRRHQQTVRGLGAEPDRVRLLRSFDPSAGAATDVPDPYYGNDGVFDECRDMIAAACHGLVAGLCTHWAELTDA